MRDTINLWNLREIRVSRGCSLGDIAEQVQVPLIELFYLERGSTAASPETAEAIADVLCVNTSDLAYARSLHPTEEVAV